MLHLLVARNRLTTQYIVFSKCSHVNLQLLIDSTLYALQCELADCIVDLRSLAFHSSVNSEQDLPAKLCLQLLEQKLAKKSELSASCVCIIDTVGKLKL